MEFVLYALLGAIAGTSAGLLGIGGGLIMVPALLMIFPEIGINGDHMVHMAIGTSLGAIVFSSISSVYSHHRHGGVMWGLFAKVAPGVVLGAVLGSAIAHYLPGDILKRIFGSLEILIAIHMGIGRQPAPSRQLPSIVPLGGFSVVVGSIASIMGMGGGAMTTPFFMWCNVAARNAIATSAAIGLPTAISGSIGYIFTGWGQQGLPSWSFGYVYLPALLGIVLFSMGFAPIGAWLAHRLPAKTLKRIFAFVLMGLGLNMLLH